MIHDVLDPLVIKVGTDQLVLDGGKSGKGNPVRKGEGKEDREESGTTCSTPPVNPARQLYRLQNSPREMGWGWLHVITGVLLSAT